MRYGSVCSGVEAASMAWESLGWEPVFFSEIEEFPSAVLKHHWPHVPNQGDMSKFEEWGYERGAIDVLVGGTPCQSFSVAGLRGGLGDQRGNLSLTYMRMVDRLRPRWTVWENVPGVLSSGGGRDFGSIIGALAELGYSCAWRVLDAQNFGVAQRRRRVFLVGCSSGDWRDPSSVLFEQSCGNRDLEKSRQTRKEDTGSSIPSVAGSLDTQCGGGKLTHQSANNGHLIVNPPDKMGTITARMFNALGARDIEEGAVQVVSSEIAPTITSSGPPYSRTGQQGSEVDALTAVIHGTQDPIISDRAHALGRNNGQENVLCFEPRSQDGVPRIHDSVCPTLNTAQGGQRQPCVVQESVVAIHDKATRHQGGGETRSNDGSGNGLGITEGGPMYTMTAGDRHGVFSQSQVRRLTPKECERLQGFPDDHTNIPWRNKEESPDSHRYKAMGNSMAVPVMRWIGERIKAREEGLL